MVSVARTTARVADAALEATVVLSFSRIGTLTRSRMDGWSHTDRLPGAGRRVLLTGANSGIGYATARRLLHGGARVHLLVRSEEKAAVTVAELERELGSGVRDAVTYDTADLTDLGSVRDAADRFIATEESLTGLVHNAGAMFTERELTVDGLERTYQLHVVAPFLLTSLLVPVLRRSAPSRVVTVTSGGMYTQASSAANVDTPDRYRPTVAYARAKRAQVTLNHEWQRRLGSRGVGFHVSHPGWVLTPGVESSLPRFRRVMGKLLRDPDEGADTVAWLTLSEPAPPPGHLWHDRRSRGEHRLPGTRPTSDEVSELWDRVRIDAGEPPLPLD